MRAVAAPIRNYCNVDAARQQLEFRKHSLDQQAAALDRLYPGPSGESLRNAAHQQIDAEKQSIEAQQRALGQQERFCRASQRVDVNQLCSVEAAKRSLEAEKRQIDLQKHWLDVTFKGPGTQAYREFEKTRLEAEKRSIDLQKQALDRQQQLCQASYRR